MTIYNKLEMVKTILGLDAPNDDTILSYLEIAKNEILQWRYSYNPDIMPTDVPAEYEMTQVYAVVTGFTQRGVEGQLVSIENGIHRHFSFTDMVNYIRQNVIAMAKLPGRATVTPEPPEPDPGDVPKAVQQYVDDHAITI